MTTKPSKELETFANPNPGRDYTIAIRIPEFTCLCPKTGQPDFATLYLDYVPERKCVELKSLKLYIWSFRDEGHFHEAVTNRIADDLLAALQPRYLRLRARFYVRGGIYTNVIVEHRAPGFTAAIPAPERREPAPEDKHRSSTTSAPAPAAEARPDSKSASKSAGAPAAAPKERPSGATRVSELARMIIEGQHLDPHRDEEPEHGRARRAKPPPAPADTVQSLDTKSPETKSSDTKSRARPGAGAPLYIGLDVGTTGCRACAIGLDGHVQAEVTAPIPAPTVRDAEVTQDASLWWKAAQEALRALCKQIDPDRVRAIAVDGTSGTVLLCDAKGKPLSPGIMYNDARARAQATEIERLAARESGAHGATSSLAKLLWFTQTDIPQRATHFVHQADWIAGNLSGRHGLSDYNNCLKLGYDAMSLEWPAWFDALNVPRDLLPTAVLAPGEMMGEIAPEIAKTFRLPKDTVVIAGTTDSVAAFVAAGASVPGDAVTSLGSTLVLKLLSDRPIFAPEHGVYSHRLGDLWLAGGASNTGGAVLLQYFDSQQMTDMEPLLKPEQDSGLDYYPLPGTGERFPINDPQMKSQTEPLPGDSVVFFQGLLEGIARIEHDGYALLHKLGGPVARNVRSVGGGARNMPWRRIREIMLRVPMIAADSEMAAVGAARIAAGMHLTPKVARSA